MAQNISIQEGSQSKQFGQVNKLKISNSGSGASLWVPEDEVQTKSLYVDKNGTYYSSKDDCYGYDEVSVNIVDEVYGYDDDGNFWDIDVDDEDFLEEEELPTEIKVVVPPDKTDYIALEPINTAGMVVKAYYGDGTEYGVIPREEYTIDPLVAPTSGIGKKTATSDIEDIQDLMPIPIADEVTGRFYSPSEERRVIWTAAQYDAKVITSHQKTDGTYLEGISASDQHTSHPMEHVYTYNDKTVYYVDSIYLNRLYDVEPVIHGYAYDGLSRERKNAIAWTMIYGEIHGGAEITVKWKRPEDEEELTDTFEISVDSPPIPPVGGEDSGSGGSSGGSW